VATLQLIVTGEGLGEGARFVLSGQDALLGRADHCDLVIESPTVSSRHGVFKAGGAGYTYTDLGSTNGSALDSGGRGAPEPLTTGQAVPLAPGDMLLLGASDAPVRVAIEAGMAPYAQAARTGGTVLARAPLSDLLRGAAQGLGTLAARVLAATTPETLAETAVDYLRALYPRAQGHAALIAGTGFAARAGAPLPRGLEEKARELDEAVLLEDAATALPLTHSIARQGIQAAVLAPLDAGRSWHGLVAAWSTLGPEALPPAALDGLAVAAPLLGLAASQLAVRRLADEERARLETENQTLRGARSSEKPLEPVGTSAAFLRALELCRAVAHSEVPILLLGETGTGKEVLARHIHERSPRRQKRLVAFNCAAVPESLVEAELFGHVRGAFTGASSDRPGLFEEADGGTIFLDEVGEMPASMQAKLLRVLQDGEVRRVGAGKTVRVDVRVVSATHRDLGKLVEEGKFRQDLMYRLNAVTVAIPRLAERGEDVLLLAHHLLAKVARRAQKVIPGFTAAAMRRLAGHGFPGNVRELENEITRAVALTPDGRAIDADSFSERLGAVPLDDGSGEAPRGGTLKGAVEAAERQAVEAAIARAGGTLSQAARDLGVTRPGLYKLMERLGLR
jgi:transcriptional regulator with GAF, ATPase, and Fis domain